METSDATWELWCRDLFDRDTPPTRDDEGTGLESGLEALWSRTLGEGVDDEGRRTLSSFHLAWGRTQHAEVAISPTGADRALRNLREWRSRELFRALARAHLQLITRATTRAERRAESLLDLARNAADAAELVRRLRGL